MTKRSFYIDAYLKESKKEASNNSSPKWLKDFFSTFRSELLKRSRNPSPGNKNIVTGAFNCSLPHLVPNGVEILPEQALGGFLSEKGKENAGLMITRKRIDFVLRKESVGIYFIEFKSNLSFNDLSAAIVEMALVKKYVRSRSLGSIGTSSMHLFPYKANINELNNLNKVMSSPLDNIWVFCHNNYPSFNISEIKKFRSSMNQFFRNPDA